jgi:hypothetical protein
MQLTQKDLNERAARKRKGEASDEDLRLIKHYIREGYEPGADIPTGPEQPGADTVNGELEVTTEAEVIPGPKSRPRKARQNGPGSR